MVSAGENGYLVVGALLGRCSDKITTRAQVEDLISSFTIHDLCGHKIRSIKKCFKGKPFNGKSFDPSSFTQAFKSSLMVRWPNVEPNLLTTSSKHLEHHTNNLGNQYTKNSGDVGKAQGAYFKFAINKFRFLRRKLIRALHKACGAGFGKKIVRRSFNSDKFLAELKRYEIYPTLHLREAAKSKVGEKQREGPQTHILTEVKIWYDFVTRDLTKPPYKLKKVFRGINGDKGKYKNGDTILIVA